MFLNLHYKLLAEKSKTAHAPHKIQLLSFPFGILWIFLQPSLAINFLFFFTVWKETWTKNFQCNKPDAEILFE